jgi:hypothetical protein
MSQKLTLARYLESRGSVKSLTRIEAEAFGVPYPLVSGWPARHGNTEITEAMVEDLAQRIAGARRSTASKALRGLNGAAGGSPSSGPRTGAARQALPIESAAKQHVEVTRSFPGFVLRPAKRSRGRQGWERWGP